MEILTNKSFQKLLNDLLLCTVEFDQRVNVFTAKNMYNQSILVSNKHVKYNHLDFTYSINEDQTDHLMCVLEFVYYRDLKAKEAELILISLYHQKLRKDNVHITSSDKFDKELYYKKICRRLPDDLRKDREYYYNTLVKDGIDFFIKMYDVLKGLDHVKYKQIDKFIKYYYSNLSKYTK